MTRSGHVWLGGLAVLVCATFGDAADSAQQAVGGENAVMAWERFALESTTVGRPPANSEYLIALASFAVWDAILAIEQPDEYEPYASSPDVTHPASSDAAVATAAFEVLRIRVPSQAGALQDKYDTFMALISDGANKTNGIAIGQSAAEGVLAARAVDGFDNVIPFVQPTPGPGVFEPTVAGTPVGVGFATVQPLAERDIGDFRAKPPAALTSKKYRGDFDGWRRTVVRPAPPARRCRPRPRSFGARRPTASTFAHCAPWRSVRVSIRSRPRG